MSKQTKLTKSARGQDCQIRIEGICNHDNTTTILAHRAGGGMGGKVPDREGAYACSACHDAVDGRSKTWLEPEQLKSYHDDGIFRTQAIMKAMGLEL